MEKDIPEPIGQKKQTERDSPHKHAAGAVTMIAGCAFGKFVLGSMCGEAWPAAVASCGLSIMGVGVACVMMRRA